MGNIYLDRAFLSPTQECFCHWRLKVFQRYYRLRVWPFVLGNEKLDIFFILVHYYFYCHSIHVHICNKLNIISPRPWQKMICRAAEYSTVNYTKYYSTFTWHSSQIYRTTGASWKKNIKVTWLHSSSRALGQQNIWRQQMVGGDGRMLEHQDVGGSRDFNRKC